MKQNNNNGELIDPVTGHWYISYAMTLSALIYGLSFLLIFGASYLISYLRRCDESAQDHPPSNR